MLHWLLLKMTSTILYAQFFSFQRGIYCLSKGLITSCYAVFELHDWLQEFCYLWFLPVAPTRSSQGVWDLVTSQARYIDQNNQFSKVDNLSLQYSVMCWLKLVGSSSCWNNILNFEAVGSERIQIISQSHTVCNDKLSNPEIPNDTAPNIHIKLVLEVGFHGTM